MTDIYKKQTRWGERTFNLATSGAVRPDLVSVAKTIAYAIVGVFGDEFEEELKPSTVDMYPITWGDTDSVSVEFSSNNTLEIQAGFDVEIEQENLGVEPIKDGLPPCKRVRINGHS